MKESSQPFCPHQVHYPPPPGIFRPPFWLPTGSAKWYYTSLLPHGFLSWVRLLIGYVKTLSVKHDPPLLCIFFVFPPLQCSLFFFFFFFFCSSQPCAPLIPPLKLFLLVFFSSSRSSALSNFSPSLLSEFAFPNNPSQRLNLCLESPVGPYHTCPLEVPGPNPWNSQGNLFLLPSASPVFHFFFCCRGRFLTVLSLFLPFVRLTPLLVFDPWLAKTSYPNKRVVITPLSFPFY